MSDREVLGDVLEDLTDDANVSLWTIVKWLNWVNKSMSYLSGKEAQFAKRGAASQEWGSSNWTS